MDIQRSILWLALIFICSLLWSAWQREHETTVPVEAEQTTTITTSTSSTKQSSPLQDTAAGKDEWVKVNTDVLEVSIDSSNGAVVSAQLKDYPAAQGSNTPFTLLSDKKGDFYVARSGIFKASTQNPVRFQSDEKEYSLANGQKQITVTLRGYDKGVSILQTYTFTRGSYDVVVNYQIDNRSGKAWSGDFYAEFIREKPQNHSSSIFHINPYVGAAISSQNDRYQKISFEHMQENNLNQNIQDGWIVFQQHYFLTAWVPEPTQTYHYSSFYDKGFYTLRVSNTVQVPIQKTQDVQFKLYMGPAIAEMLKKTAKGLDLTVDYGIFWMLGVAIFWLLSKINLWVHNWGWSIVLVTVIIKLLFYHLSAKSYRSMAGMRKLQPRIMALRERLGEDRQALGKATMELYKKEKINPLGGCLPIVVQIPVFIALYWVLLESVQLRQAPFILWIHDLAVPDPYYILPIVMGATMLIQQKLSPPPPDPMQAKMMMLLPVIFTIFFLNFPAGLVLYWLVNNTLSILQQWYVTYQFERADKEKKYRR